MHYYKGTDSCNAVNPLSALASCSAGNNSRRQVVLNSSSGSAGPLPIITTLFSEPINVVSTSIDTRGMSKTTNLLIFTGIVNLPINASISLNFQILRSINGRAPVKVGSTYTFSTTAQVAESESFSFQFADTGVDPDFYTYAVELSTNSIINIAPGVTVNNATLTILAVEV